MPYFEFKCPACGKEFERYYKATQQKTKCDCGGWADKQITVPNVQFRGDGFTKSTKQ